jgi:hypothetical protein
MKLWSALLFFLSLPWFQGEGILVVVGVVGPPHSPLEVEVFLG